MKNKLLFISFIILLFLTICGAITIATGLGSWLWFSLSASADSPLTRLRMEFADVPPTATSSHELAATLPIATPSATIIVATPLENTATPASTSIATTPTTMPLPTATVDEIAKVRGFALPVGSVNAVTKEGVATQLVIPKLKLDASVVLSPIENGTWEVESLGQNLVGHLEGTAPPGSNSNIVLAAHVTVAANVYGPFAGLSLLTPGDDIFVYDHDKKFHYQVVDYQLVDRSNIEVTYPSQQSEITLITCSRWSKEDGRYLERLVVKGRLVSP